MDFNELLHCLEGMRVINRQLSEKLEKAQKECAVYREFKRYAESNLNSTADKPDPLGRNCRIYTMDFVYDVDLVRSALEVLNIYDGIQFLITQGSEEKHITWMARQTAGLSGVRYTKGGKQYFTIRRNSKGLVVWRYE